MHGRPRQTRSACRAPSRADVAGRLPGVENDVVTGGSGGGESWDGSRLTALSAAGERYGVNGSRKGGRYGVNGSRAGVLRREGLAHRWALRRERLARGGATA